MKPIKMGILSAIIASACCTVPLALIALGLGGLGAGAIIGRHHWIFLSFGILLILFSWRRYFREKKECNLRKCRMENKRVTLAALTTATIIVLFFAGSNFYSHIGIFGDAVQTAPGGNPGTVTIPVQGMTCFSCGIAVTKALKKLKGVTEASASVKEKNVKVTYETDKTNIGKLIETIERAGYKASLPERHKPEGA